MSPVTGWGFTRTSPAFSEKKVCTQSSERAGLFLSKKANFQRPERLKKKELKPSCSLSQQLWGWYRKKPHQPKLRQLKTVPPYLSVVCAVSRGWFSNLPTCGCGSKAELQGGWAPLPLSNPHWSRVRLPQQNSPVTEAVWEGKCHKWLTRDTWKEN